MGDLSPFGTAELRQNSDFIRLDLDEADLSDCGTAPGETGVTGTREDAKARI